MEIVKVETKLETKFLKFNETTYKDKNGNEKKWDWIQRSNNPKIVMIVPFYQDKIILIKEFRVPIADYEYGFPAGLVDQNELIEDAVYRELKEETGLNVVKILSASPPLFNSAGLTDEAITIVFVICDGEISNKGNESSEEIEVLSLDANSIANLLIDDKNKFGAKAWLIITSILQTQQMFIDLQKKGS